MSGYNNFYSGNPLYNYMEELSEQLGAPVINNTIELPAALGNGFVKNLFLEEGFCIRYYRFHVRENLVFRWTTDQDKDDSIFKLLFNFEQADAAPKRPQNNAAVLYSTDFVKATMIEKNKVANRIVFLFTKKWLEDNFGAAAQKIAETVDYLVSKHMPTYIAEDMDATQAAFTSDLSTQMMQDHFPMINIKTKSLILVNSFLTRIVCRNPLNNNLNQSLYYTEMAQLEKRLTEHLDKPLPNIEQLAAEVNLSAATLKRHFKIVYGNSIYNYYLEKKMALGKTMIAAKNKTISEIAYTLGYNKINSFSKAFKKQYGFLPREMSIYQAI